MTLFLYNSETRIKEPFKPIIPKKIGLYVCGMTVYDYCHIGHARVMVAFDVMVRYWRSQGYVVDYVRNITDIDDKIIARANANKEDIHQLTTRYITAMNDDADKLGCLRPDVAPKATEYIEQMQQMIGTLVDKKHAYAADNGDVYYAVDSFADYGRLSGRQLQDLQVGARVDVDVAKRNPLDFVLWKAAKLNEPSWKSPWGQGRPGWHIECSAMSTCCLGHSFDIHGGGGDLLFPHHENELAQSEAATGKKYVNTWLHVGFVNVDGEKMSKSLGNFFTIRDVMQVFLPETIRYFIVSSHYRSPLNFSDSALKDAHQALSRFYNTLKLLPVLSDQAPEMNADLQKMVGEYELRFTAAMDDDINTPEALAVLFDMVRAINTALRNLASETAVVLAWSMRKLANILGLLTQEPQAFLQGQATVNAALSDADISQFIEARTMAKLNKNFKEADQIRQTLLAQGVVLEDSKSGTTWRRGS